MGDRPSLLRRALEDARSRTIDIRAFVASSLVAGAVFLVIAVVGHAAVPETSAWDTPLRVASLLVGADVQESASTSRPGLFVVAALVHAMLSLTYGLLLDLGTNRMTRRQALVTGALFGVGLYFFNYHLLAPLLPAFTAARGPVVLVAHVAFGLTAVVVFRSARRVPARRPESLRWS